VCKDNTDIHTYVYTHTHVCIHTHTHTHTHTCSHYIHLHKEKEKRRDTMQAHIHPHTHHRYQSTQSLPAMPQRDRWHRLPTFPRKVFRFVTKEELFRKRSFAQGSVPQLLTSKKRRRSSSRIRCDPVRTTSEETESRFSRSPQTNKQTPCNHSYMIVGWGSSESESIATGSVQ
jgi:hypothetical protein